MGVDFSATDWTYYSVGGATLSEVASQIAHLPEAGETRWDHSFRYETDEHGTVCDVTVTVSTTVNLPDWSDYAHATPAEQYEWDRFRHALVLHENGHVDLVTTHLTGLDQTMLGGTPHHAQSAFEHAVHALHEASVAYDAQTDHGRTAGTIIELS